MSDIDLINREIESLEILANEIENQVVTLIEGTSLLYKPDPPGVISGFPDYEWARIPENLKMTQRSAIRNYQRYFSSAVHYITDFLPEREEEFQRCYEAKDYFHSPGIMDFLQFKRGESSNNKNEIIDNFISRFEIQRSILLSIPFIAKIKEKKLREIISVDFIEREIDQSEYLFNINCYRAAGALAGVALEQHLKVLCEKYELVCKKKDTIEPLVQKLYENKKIDLSIMKRIQHLASLRDKCAHPSDVEKGEIKELIEGVKRIV
ncbi:MAG: DUF4145 domain-containing protein [Methanomicrobiales archaeon]|nr:DUF4145 domain-containing protein [Methanomicrobiales archaeon]